MRATSLRVLAAVALSAALVACGSSKSNNNSNNAANTNNAPAASVAASGGTPKAGVPQTPQSINASAASQPAGKPKLGGTLTLGIFSDITSLDSAKSQDIYSGYVESNVLDALFTTVTDSSGGFKIVGKLVDKWENPDPTTEIWHLHPGVKFQDGTDFNADAVKWNIQRHIDDKTSVRHADVTPITDMTVVDPLTLKLTLNAPYAPLHSKLTGGAGYMYSPTQFQKVGASAVSSDLTNLGSGPFKFTSWQKGAQVTLDKNPNYWQKDPNGIQYPYLDKLVFKPIPDENTRETSLKTGDLDYIDAPPPKDVKALASNSDLTYKQIPGLGFGFIMLNTTKPPFDNKLVRQALSYAIDRQQIADTVFFDTVVPADTEIPATLFGSVQGPYMKQDVAKAKSLLQQAGMTNVSLSMQFSAGSTVIQQVLELIKDQAKAAGFDITLQPIEFATLIDNANKASYQAGYLGWNGAADPDGFVSPLFRTGAGFNLSHYSNPALDKQIDAAQQSYDQSVREPLYKQIMQTLADDEPFIITDWTAYSQTTRKNVQNWQLGPSAITDLYEVWKS